MQNTFSFRKKEDNIIVSDHSKQNRETRSNWYKNSATTNKAPCKAEIEMRLYYAVIVRFFFSSHWNENDNHKNNDTYYINITINDYENKSETKIA